jgi:LysR family glycine cleavage system transcriptional activator
MSEWLPSLNALRAFAAVCRHLSYARAAEELHVTPAAVKQLVRKLEDSVGHPLVLRHGRGLAVSPAGLAGLEELSLGFARIDRAVERMRRHSDRQRLIVSVEPSFATAWLVPRLDRFRKDNADVDVLIDSSLKLADLERGEADTAIRFGAAPEPPLIGHRLFDERLCAFCSPALVRGENALQRVEDLHRVTLLHWEMSELGWATATRKWMEWQSWLDKVGVRRIDRKRGIRFNDYNLAVQSAIAGQGVVLGSLPVLHDLVEAGLLVNPFAEIVDTNIGYDLVTPEESLARPEVRRFANWIIAEARSTQLHSHGGSAISPVHLLTDRTP